MIMLRFMIILSFGTTEIKAREDKSAHFFEVEEVDPLTEALDRRLNQQAQMLAEDNSRFVEQREKEIQSIVKSISDLNSIFKELATMVTEQVSLFFKRELKLLVLLHLYYTRVT